MSSATEGFQTSRYGTANTAPILRRWDYPGGWLQSEAGWRLAVFDESRIETKRKKDRSRYLALAVVAATGLLTVAWIAAMVTAAVLLMKAVFG